MGVRLTNADDAYAKCVGRIARHDERGTAVRDRTAVEQLQRRGDRLRRHHVLHADRLAKLRSRMRARMAAHQHRQLGEIFLGDAVLVHVPRCHQRVVRRNGRAERHFVHRMPHLSQRLHRIVTRLTGEPILARDHEHVACGTGFHQVVREHDHRESGRAADLNRVRVARTQPVVLDERRRQHQMRKGGRVATNQTVDVVALELRILQSGGGGVAHQVERVASGQLAVRGHADACNPAHGRTS